MDFLDDCDLVTLNLEVKQKIIHDYFNAISKTQTSETMEAKYWGSTGVMDLFCILVNRPIFIIEVNNFEEDISVTKIVPIPWKTGRAGAKIFTSTTTLSTQEFIAETAENVSTAGENHFVLVHRDQAHYNTVLYPKQKQHAMDWKNYFSLKTLPEREQSNTTGSTTEATVEVPDPIHLDDEGFEPHMQQMENHLDEILQETKSLIGGQSMPQTASENMIGSDQPCSPDEKILTATKRRLEVSTPDKFPVKQKARDYSPITETQEEPSFDLQTTSRDRGEQIFFFTFFLHK